MDWLSTLLTNETLLQFIGAYFILQQATTVGESLPMRYTWGQKARNSFDIGFKAFSLKSKPGNENQYHTPYWHYTPSRTN